MKEILIYARQLELDTYKERKTERFNITLYEHEATAFLGNDETLRKDFFEYLKGGQRRVSGYFEFMGRISKTEYIEEGISDAIYISKKFVYGENKESSFSIEEYLFLFEKSRSNKIVWNKRNEKKKVKNILSEYIPYEISSNKINGLKTIEYRIVDILRAWLVRAKLVIINEDFESYTKEDLELLKGVLEKMKLQGMTFVLNVNTVKGVEILCDRVYFIEEGTITKKIANYPQIHSELIHILSNKKIEEKCIPTIKKDGGFLYKVIMGSKSQQESYGFYRQEVVNVVIQDLERKRTMFYALSGIQEFSDVTYEVEGKKIKYKNLLNNKIIGLSEIGNKEQFFFNMSVGENLFMLASSKKNKGSFFISLKRVNAMKQVWEKERGGTLPKDMAQISKNERIELSFEERRIFKPRVLVLLDPYLYVDEKGRNMIAKYIRLMRIDQCTVIIISSVGKLYEQLSDRKLIIE